MPKRRNGPPQGVSPAQRQKRAVALTPPAANATAEAAPTVRRLEYNASDVEEVEEIEEERRQDRMDRISERIQERVSGWSEEFDWSEDIQREMTALQKKNEKDLPHCHALTVSFETARHWPLVRVQRFAAAFLIALLKGRVTKRFRCSARQLVPQTVRTG